MLIAAVAGFAPAIVNPVRRLGPVTSLVLVHGLLFSAWLILFTVQAGLIATHRTAVHRRLGIAAAVLAAIMLPVGYSTVMEQTRRGFDLSGELNVKSDPIGEAVFPLGDLVTFTVLVIAGLWHRRRPELHKRLMTLGTIGGMMPAVLGHIVGHYFSTTPVVLVPMVAIAFFAPAVFDRIREGRFNPLTVWGGIGLFAWANLRAAVIRPTAPWRDLVEWLAG